MGTVAARGSVSASLLIQRFAPSPTVGLPMLIGVGAELDAMAAMVIGGQAFWAGGAANTFIGVVLLGVIANITNLANAHGHHQQAFMGLIIIGAMLLHYGTTALRR